MQTPVTLDDPGFIPAEPAATSQADARPLGPLYAHLQDLRRLRDDGLNLAIPPGEGLDPWYGPGEVAELKDLAAVVEGRLIAAVLAMAPGRRAGPSPTPAALARAFGTAGPIRCYREGSRLYRVRPRAGISAQALVGAVTPAQVARFCKLEVLEASAGFGFGPDELPEQVARNEVWRREHEDGVIDPATGRIVRRSIRAIAKAHGVSKSAVERGIRSAGGWGVRGGRWSSNPPSG